MPSKAIQASSTNFQLRYMARNTATKRSVQAAPEDMQYAIVTRSTGSWYEVELEDGQRWSCRAKGRFRIAGLRTTNPIAVGDRVGVVSDQDGDEDTGMIVELAPRRNYVLRQSPRKRHELHILAANIDLAILVMTVVEPMLKQGLIDRFLLSTEPYDIPTALVFNKADLYDDEALGIYAALEDLYTAIGYQVMLVSAAENVGIDALRDLLRDKTTLISGQSGVGKSSLLNAVQPGLEARVGEISDYSGKGQHTTTFAEMHDLAFGGKLIDTPGIKNFSFNHLQEKEVADNFREFFALSQNCRFNNCLHREEPGCAVKAAVDAGEASELRYINYLTILQEVEDQNYWEIHTDV